MTAGADDVVDHHLQGAVNAYFVVVTYRVVGDGVQAHQESIEQYLAILRNLVGRGIVGGRLPPRHRHLDQVEVGRTHRTHLPNGGAYRIGDLVLGEVGVHRLAEQHLRVARQVLATLNLPARRLGLLTRPRLLGRNYLGQGGGVHRGGFNRCFGQGRLPSSYGNSIRKKPTGKPIGALCYPWASKPCQLGQPSGGCLPASSRRQSALCRAAAGIQAGRKVRCCP